MKKDKSELMKPLSNDDTVGNWVTIYSDMMTNLMIFFLILWAYTQFIRKIPDAIPGMPTPEKVTSPVRDDIKKELDSVGTVVLTERKMTITLPSAVLFDLGKADLKEEAKESLQKVAFSLSRSTAPIVVEGHTDDIPIKLSKWRSNYELSAARAFSVIRYFTEQGVPANRLAGRGYGPFRPVIPNLSDENRAKNRRIEIHLLTS